MLYSRIRGPAAAVLLAVLVAGGGCTQVQQLDQAMDRAEVLLEKIEGTAGGLTGSVMALPATLANMGEKMVAMIEDQGVLDKWTIDADGNFINPGLEVSATLKLALAVNLIGTSGSIEGGGGGEGTQLPRDVRAKLIEQLGLPLSDAQRQKILDILGWNRGQTPPP